VNDHVRLLVDFAAEHGRKLLTERIERIERDLAERRPAVVVTLQKEVHFGSMIGNLQCRLDAAKLALAEGNGFAAGWLIKEAEQMVATINATLAAPMVKAAAGSAGGREQTRSKIRATLDEKLSDSRAELKRLDDADAEDHRHKKQKSKKSRAERIAPLFKLWAEKNKEEPLAVGTIRKLLRDRK
jgi:hypothetical protein